MFGRHDAKGTNNASGEIRGMAHDGKTSWDVVAASARCGAASVTEAKIFVIDPEGNCSGQPIPDTALSFSSTTAGASPLLN